MSSFIHACPGDDDEEEEEEGEEGEEKMPTCGDYIMHFLTLFWKILFSIIPPAGEELTGFTVQWVWVPG